MTDNNKQNTFISLFGPPGSQEQPDEDSFSYHENGEDELMEDAEEQAINQSVNDDAGDNRIAIDFNQFVEFQPVDEKSFANPSQEVAQEHEQETIPTFDIGHAIQRVFAGQLNQEQDQNVLPTSPAEKSTAIKFDFTDIVDGKQHEQDDDISSLHENGEEEIEEKEENQYQESDLLIEQCIQDELNDHTMTKEIENNQSSIIEFNFGQESKRDEQAENQVIDIEMENTCEQKVGTPNEQQVVDTRINLGELGIPVEDFMDEIPKQPKPPRNRVHFGLADFYNLRKVKYTLDFGESLRNKELVRSQFIYTLDRKTSNDLKQILDNCKKQDHKRVYIDLGLHIKQHTVREIWLLKKGPDNKYFKKEKIEIPPESDNYGTMPQLGASNNQKQSNLKSWYLTPQKQAKLFQLNFASLNNEEGISNVSKDLNSLDFLQHDLCYYKESSQSNDDGIGPRILGKKPELHIQKFMTLKLRKCENQEIIEQQLPEEIKMLITLGNPISGDGQSEHISNFGIKSIDYKIEDTQMQQNSSLGTYFMTSDAFEASQLWIPQFFGTTRLPVNWTMNYIIPAGTQVISCGKFIRQSDLIGSGKVLYSFKSKENPNSALPTKIIPDKIGFVIGQFAYVSEIEGKGAAVFLKSAKHQLFEAKQYYPIQFQQVIEYIEKMLKIEHPCNVKHFPPNNQHFLKLVFVPNLLTSKGLKQSVDFSNCLHIFDENILLPRNVIEKRHHIFKIIATSVSFDYFGNQVWEEVQQDAWLTTSLRERIGDLYKRSQCGHSFYRYSISKRMTKFFNLVKSNSERFSLSSNFIPHRSEMQFGEDTYLLKCQLVMHIIDQILGETHFYNISRELFRKSKPTLSLALFKRLLRDIGIKFQDIQKNWIESTSCPKITCNFTYNARKNNSVDIVIEQQSAVKAQLLFEKHTQTNKGMPNQLCSEGRLLMKSLKSTQLTEQIDRTNSFNVEIQRDCKRWFNGEVKVIIYQTDGAEITAQTQKIKLRYPKSKVQCNIPLQCKVRKAIHNKKRDENMLLYEFNGTDTKAENGEGNKEQAKPESKATAAEQLQQLMNDNNQWRFGMTDYEYEEFPERGTKSLFEVKNIDCPILWIRVDPDFEYIRKVKVNQTKENWLFQLLQERDHIAQIEACKALRKYHEEFVYEILISVAKNEKFFFKVRKQALKSLEEIQVGVFSKFLSHEKSFLVSYFNLRNFNEKIGFFKSNDFKNVLEYFINTYMLRSLAKSKEHKMPLIEDLQQVKLKKIEKDTLNLNLIGIPVTNDLVVSFNLKSLTNQLSFIDKDKDADDAELKKKQAEMADELIDLRDFSTTTDLIANLFIRLLRENDNSENAFDDCFLISKILSCLGKLDNFRCMPQIATEITRQFNLDRIGKFSAQFAVTKGAIKGYYNLRKQLHTFKHFKLPYLDQQRCKQEIDQIQKSIQTTESILESMKQSLENILNDEAWPLEIRAFIFEKQIKNMFRFSQDPLGATKIPEHFLNPLYHILQNIRNNLKQERFHFGSIQMQLLAQFLERNFIKRLNYKECLSPDNPKPKVIANLLWYIMAEQPANVLDRQMSFWTKRVYNTLFGSQVPAALHFEQLQRQIQKAYPVQLDKDWHDSEIQQQIASDQQEVLRQKAGIKDDLDPLLGADFVGLFPQADLPGQIPFQTDPTGAFLTQAQQSFFTSLAQPTTVFDLSQNQIDFNQLLQQADQPIDNSNVIKLDLGMDLDDAEVVSPQKSDYKRINYGDWPDKEMSQVSNAEELVYQVEIDDFPDYKFQVVWQQKCWDILYRLYYDIEAGAFLQDISEEAMGQEFYQDYVSTIKYPINFLMIKQKLIKHFYPSAQDFVDDMLLVFDNCMEYNQRSSGFYKSAVKMKKKFKNLIKQQRVI